MTSNGNETGEPKELADLEAQIGYQFQDKKLLHRAMTHRSYANETRGVETDNQRLEFLGDAVLGLVMADALFGQDEAAPEGALSSRLSELVCEPALVDRADDWDLGEYLRLGRGEELTGGREKEGLLADAYEALLGAIYLDSGYETVQQAILTHFDELIDAVIEGRRPAASKSPGDFKSLLQREVQSRRPVRPEYRIAETFGPPHDRRFVSEVLVAGQVVGRGEGPSKKQAEQAAAQEAVAGLEVEGGLLRAVLEEQSAQDSTSD